MLIIQVNLNWNKSSKVKVPFIIFHRKVTPYLIQRNSGLSNENALDTYEIALFKKNDVFARTFLSIMPLADRGLSI